MPQLGASLTFVILIALELSFVFLESSIMLLWNISSTGIASLIMIFIYSSNIFIVLATGFLPNPGKLEKTL
jgi:hypothetical protein